MKAIYTILLCLSLISTANAQQNWQLSRDENGIKVYTSESPNSPVKSVRVEMSFKQSATKVADMVMNVSKYPEWIYGCLESTLIKKVNDSVLIYRHVTDAPWPFEDRDQVSQFVRTINKQTGVISITSAIQNDYPEKEGYVRIKHSKSSWVITPQKDGTVKIVYQLSFDPGGNVPTWMMNMFITDGPYHSFLNLQKKIDG